MKYMEVHHKLQSINQEHILDYYDELTDSEKKELLKQINKLDFSVLEHLNKRENNTDECIESLKALEIPDIKEKEDIYKNIGIASIRNNKVAALILAGGQGTRLGHSEPKGMCNIGITKEVYIFQRLFENILEVVEVAGEYPHIIIMTSEQTNRETRKFLKEKKYFGYKEDKIHFFVQDTNITTDLAGKVYMESKGRIATSPNGNGGWLESLRNTSLMNMLKTYNIEWLNVVSVDNVLQRICDPVFIGATIDAEVGVGAKVVRKAHVDEKVGVMCIRNGKPSIVEYYELTDELRSSKDKNGEPLYNFGVILNYLFNIKELDKIDKNEVIHLVKKKINHIDKDGNLVKPEEPNGYKFETLVLDLINQMDNCLPFEVERNREFAPIKNRTGVDSIDTARELLQMNGITL